MMEKMLNLEDFEGRKREKYESGLEMLADIAALETENWEKEHNGTAVVESEMDLENEQQTPVTIKKYFKESVKLCLGVPNINERPVVTKQYCLTGQESFKIFGQKVADFSGKALVIREELPFMSRSSTELSLEARYRNSNVFFKEPLDGQQSAKRPSSANLTPYRPMTHEKLLKEKALKRPVVTSGLCKKFTNTTSCTPITIREELLKEKAWNRLAVTPGPSKKFGNTTGKKRCFEATNGKTVVIKIPRAKKQKNIEEFGPHDKPQLIKDIEALEEDINKVELVIHKALEATDVSKGHARLSIPLNKTRAEFLTEDEKEILNKRNGNRRVEINVRFIEPSDQVHSISIKKWDMPKDNSKTSFMYALGKSWNSVVVKNELQAGDIIQVWSFREATNLCLALIVVRKGGQEAST